MADGLIAAPLIFEKLIAVMRSIGAVDKSGVYDDKAGTRYNFRGVDAVVNAVAPAFREHGIIVMPTILGVERETFDRELRNGRTGKQFRCIPRVQYTFYASDGSSVSAIVEGESLDTSDKGTAKAQSVAYRVALLQCLNLPTDDPDPDSERPEVISPHAAQSAPQPRSEPAAVTPDMSKPLASMSIAELRGAAKEMGHDFGNGAITKAEMIRQLEPLVKALSGDEPFETDAPPIPYVEEPTKPFEPVVANPAAFVRRDDELRNMRPDVRASVRKGGD